MRLLPNESFAIETTTDITELVGCLSAVTRPQPLGVDNVRDLPMTLRYETLFVGDIASDGFQLRRVINYPWLARPALPYLFGSLHRTTVGTVINVDIRYARATKVMLIVFGCGLLLFTLAFGQNYGEDQSIAAAWLATFAALVYAGLWLGIRIEVNEARRVLEKVCRAPSGPNAH